MSPKPDPAQALKQLEKNLEELGRRGVRNLGDLLGLLGDDARAKQLQQRLKAALATRPTGRAHAADDGFEGGETR